MISFQSLSLETIVIIAFVVVLVALSMRYGKSFLISYIVALYPVYLVAVNLPAAVVSTKASGQMMNVIVVLLVFAAAFAAVRVAVSSYFSYGLFKYVQAGLLAVAGTVLTLVLYYAIGTHIALPNFLVSTSRFILGFAPMWIWLAAPIAVVFATGRE